MMPPPNESGLAASERVWGVGPLMRALADVLAQRFNPVVVRGEISGFSRAASGHCYFALKDDSGQVRCAMFRRAAQASGLALADGQQVQVWGRLDVYGPRGELQLVVDRVQAVGQGALFEQFLRLKTLLGAEGLFDVERKRAMPTWPRSIGVVTSLGAAALHDVVSTLRRRVPHLPVVIYPTAVQGVQAPEQLCAALRLAYEHHSQTGHSQVLLLVRGGGSLEDLWAFNDEAVVRTVAQAPMPVVSGVGHETDFTLVDFVADLRAPTPTAAAQLCAPDRQTAILALHHGAERLHHTLCARLDSHAQHLDRLAARLGRPSSRVHERAHALYALQYRLRSALEQAHERERRRVQQLSADLAAGMQKVLAQHQQTLDRHHAALGLLDPHWVLQRGYAVLTDMHGLTITRASQTQPGQLLRATLADAQLSLSVQP